MQIKSAAAAVKVIRVINSCEDTAQLGMTINWATKLEEKDYFKLQDTQSILKAAETKHTELTGELPWVR